MKADSNSNNMNALVAQLDRVTGYEPVGRGFESLQARQAKKTSQNVMSFLLSREGQSLGISCHWHDIFILPPLQARQKKHCNMQCFFFFALPFKLRVPLFFMGRDTQTKKDPAGMFFIVFDSMRTTLSIKDITICDVFFVVSESTLLILLFYLHKFPCSVILKENEQWRFSHEI